MLEIYKKRGIQCVIMGICLISLTVVGCKSSDSDDNDEDGPLIPNTCTGTSTTAVDTSGAEFGAPPNMSVGATYKYDQSTKRLYTNGTLMGEGPPKAFSLQFAVKELTATRLVLADSSDDTGTSYGYTRNTGSPQIAGDISGSWTGDASGDALLLLTFQNMASFFAGSNKITYYAANGTYTVASNTLTLVKKASGFSEAAVRDNGGDITFSSKIEGSQETITLTPAGGAATDFERQDQYSPGCGIIGTWKHAPTMGKSWYYEFFANGTYRVFSTDDE